MSDPSTPKKRGAPFGNQNALRHGAYVRRPFYQLPEPRKKGKAEDAKPELKLTREISFLRLYYFRLAILISLETDPVKVAAGLRALSLAATAITRLVQTENFLRDRWVCKAQYDYLDQAEAEIRVAMELMHLKKAVPDPLLPGSNPEPTASIPLLPSVIDLIPTISSIASRVGVSESEQIAGSSGEEPKLEKSESSTS